MERMRTSCNGRRGANDTPNRNGTMRGTRSNHRFQPYVRHGSTSDGQSPVGTDVEDAEDNQAHVNSESLLNVIQTEYVGPPGPLVNDFTQRKH